MNGNCNSGMAVEHITSPRITHSQLEYVIPLRGQFIGVLAPVTGDGFPVPTLASPQEFAIMDALDVQRSSKRVVTGWNILKAL